MAEPHEHEFLSLEPRTFLSDDDSNSSPFDTLWTEFARSHPRLSPPQSPSARIVEHRTKLKAEDSKNEQDIDLRALEYVSDYDNNLMCPICHIPLIDPLVLDCDHTFCTACFEQYSVGGSNSDRSKCPSCRSYHLGSSRKASRLVKNMCNDVRVRCPNGGCDIITARGCIAQHVNKECPEQLLSCPDSECGKQTKRRNFVPAQCIHSSHVECECGANIELGRGDWLRHRDEECPNTGINCDKCGQRLGGKVPGESTENHDCPSTVGENNCPGRDFGCAEENPAEELENHIKGCPFARLAPIFKKQSLLLQSLQEQLTMTKIRNDKLETGFDRIHDLLVNQIQPKLDKLSHHSNLDHDIDADVEEIERHDLPTGSATGHRDLLLPAHIRSITPSPEPQHHQSHQSLQLQHLIQSHNHLEAQLSHITQSLTDLDARSSMALMNETLRMREDLAHQNAALYSTRAQVQWLLNRERIAGQREAMAGMNAMRGRQQSMQGNQNTQNTSNQGQSSVAGTSTDTNSRPGLRSDSISSAADGTLPTPQSSMPIPIPNQVPSTASAGSSLNTSPMFSSVRPSLRRHSGGSSQERVKL